MVNIYTKLCLLVAAIFAGSVFTTATAQTPEFYNNFNGTSTNSFPLNSTTSNKVQWILAPGTLNSMGPSGAPAYAGLITHVYFRVNTANPTSVYSDFTISLGQNFGSATVFSTTAGAFNFLTGLTQCFYAPTYSLTGVTAASWYGVELQTPFAYDPTLALIFELKVSAGIGNSVGQFNTTGNNERVWGLFSNTAGSTGTGLVNFGIDLSFAPVPNNAGLTALPSISNGFCADTIPVTAKIVNFGNNVIDSVYVDWTVNNVAQPGQWHVLGLDTFGSGDNDTIVEIGTYSFLTGNVYDVKAWTTLPNNEPDTVNLNDTTEVTVGPALAGTYIIGASTNADYANFTEAANALNTLGVCDHVIFEVESGTYNEQISIGQILGSDTNRTVTFQGQSGDSTDVTLTFAGTFTQTSVVRLSGASYMRFKHMTINNTSTSYDHAISIEGTAKDIEIERCHFIGNFASTSTNAAILFSSTGNNDDILIRKNRFEGGGYAIYMYGVSTVSLENGLEIIDNEMINQYYHTVRLYYQNAPVIRGNYVTSNSTFTVGAAFYFLYCDNAMEISNNHIVTDPTSTIPWPYYGIYLTLCDGAGFTNAGRIFNNRVIVGADTNTTSTSTFYGLFMSSTNAQRVTNNTITVMNGGSIGRAYYQTSSNLIFIENNLFTSYATGGHAGYYLSGINVVVDNNNYYAPNGSDVYYLTGNFTLEDYRIATGYDSNSLNVNPEWSDIYQGYLCNDQLDGNGTPISYVPTDYSGFVRSTTAPDPGAVEYVSVSNFSLGGNDTICGNSHSIELSGAVTSIAWQVNGNVSSGSQVNFSTSGTVPAQFNVNVALTSGNGCGSATDNAIYTLVPNAALDSNSHFCADVTGTLQAGGGNQATYLWIPTGETTPSINVTSTGTYSVIKTELGCVSQSSTEVTKSVGVELLDVEICNDDMPYVADASIPDGLNYAWNGGNSPATAVNTFTDAGIYSVTATDEFGCLSSASFNLNVIDQPDVVIGEVHYGNLYLFTSANSLNVGSNATYFWNFGDGNTSADPNPQHLYQWSSVPQTYTVSLTIVNECGSDVSNFIVQPDPLGVSEVGPNQVTVFPNPADDHLTILLDDEIKKSTISIVDGLGRTLMQEAQNGQQSMEFNVSNLASGHYIVRIASEKGLVTKPFIVQ